MHFHLPKPLNGWREFVGEVGIIVIGVLIALGAEQVVEAVHDRHVAHETQANIKLEIENNLGSVQLRLTQEPCVEKRLQQLHAMIDQWSRTGFYNTPTFIGSPAHAATVSIRYEAAQAAGRLPLLSSDEQYRMGHVTQGMKHLEDEAQQEGLPWARLQILRSGAASLGPTDRTLVRDALQIAEFLDHRVRGDAIQLIRRAERNGFRPDMGQLNEQIRNYSTTGRYSPPICLPLNASPADVARVTGQPIDAERQAGA